MKIADRPIADAQRDRWQFILFVLAGGIAAVVNILSRLVLNLVMPYEISIAVAYICGMTTAYLLNKMFVFAASGRQVSNEYMRFTLVNIVALAQVWLVSVGLARLLFPAIGFGWHSETVAHIIGVIVPVFTSYLGHKHFSFAVDRRKSAGE